MNNLVLRAATRNDAADLALLDNIAGNGISVFFWQQAVEEGKATDAYDWGRMRLMDDEAMYGWKNTVIAELDGQTCGACNGYIMPPIDPDYIQKSSPLFVPVFGLFSKTVGQWVIDSLAVYSNNRGQGIGAALLDNCFERARTAGAISINLVTEDSNQAALSLYASRGFSEQDRRPYIPFNNTSKTKNWLLLTAPLT